MNSNRQNEFKNNKQIYKKIRDTGHYSSEIIMYYVRLKDLILKGDLLKDEIGCETITQHVIEDINKKELDNLLLNDQRCSKVVEIILGISTLSIIRLFSKVEDELKKSDEYLESNDFKDNLFNRLEESTSNFVTVCIKILNKMEYCIFNQYSSHIIQTTLESIILLNSHLQDCKIKIILEKLELLQISLMVNLQNLTRNIGWIKIICDPCGSHVARTIILSCIGDIKFDINGLEEHILSHLGRRNRGSRLNLKFNNQNFLLKVPIMFKEFLLCKASDIDGDSLSGQIYECLRSDVEGIIYDPYASPTLSVLCFSLYKIKDEFPTKKGVNKLNKYNPLYELLSCIITLGQKSKDILNPVKKVEKIKRYLVNCSINWMNSEIASCTLEMLIELIPDEVFTLWISSHCNTDNLESIKDINLDNKDVQISLINKMVSSCYGNYIIQKILKSNRLNEPDFIQLIKVVDFQVIFKSGYIGVLNCILETCRKFQSHYKLVTKNIWKAIELKSSNDYKYAFACLIFCKTRSELQNIIEEREINIDKVEGELEERIGGINDSTIIDDKDSFEIVKRSNENKLSRLSTSIYGCNIINSLIHFPAETIHPVISGITYFISHFKEIMVKELGMKQYGVKMIESMVGINSQIPITIIRRWINAFSGHFLELGLNNNGSFAVSAMYKASDKIMKRKIVQELLDKENGGADVIKSRNYSLYKRCEIPLYLELDEKLWDISQSQKTKTRIMFSDILKEEPEIKNKNINNEILSNSSENRANKQKKENKYSNNTQYFEDNKLDIELSKNSESNEIDKGMEGIIKFIKNKKIKKY
ncbi:uncharacterized protein CMU_038840 [Cryptosporidium muris RN66]|uniref:Uncharacterized protein n=1 Tax=Cryptosporidium muris (strain RN66) TaxID=441375 RepID=B6A9C6_CRYMR|nr:uncharacterized protein CMU_038840 [Cryptosporidium muris RN66]EEA04817.1 hypothetical protein, conserved [Cryptosporidium muris RN66]|eukprot:XP_002139166.1 hypothetical protein [Cryptosporidium muris RN66]